MIKYKNIRQFIRAYKEKRPDGHFFDKKTLEFFGETIDDMVLRDEKVEVRDYDGDIRVCYMLSSLQQPPYGPRVWSHHYFDVDTFAHVFGDVLERKETVNV